MNLSKFSIADVLTVSSALLFGFVCFLSYYFFSLGNTTQSIALSAIITFSLGGTALGAKLLKKTNRNFRFCFIWEIILLVLFTCLSIVFSFFPFPQYFAVSGQKTEIQGKLSASIIQVENMFSSYEQYAKNQENLYKSKLWSVVISKDNNYTDYTDCGFLRNGITDDEQIKNKMRTLHFDLFPTNYSDSINKNGIKDVALIWLSDAKVKVTGWKPIGIVKVINDVEQSSKSWLDTLVQQSKAQEKCEPKLGDFSYPLPFEDVKKYFSTLSEPNLLSIGIAVALYFLMLLSYLITKRSTKSSIGTTKSKGKFDLMYNKKQR